MKGPTSIRKDPACGTCRKKCRKCDRTRPVCKRCTDKGLHCEGYPDKFTFLDFGAPNVSSQSTGKPKNGSKSPDTTTPATASSGSTPTQSQAEKQTDLIDFQTPPSSHGASTFSSPSGDHSKSSVDSILPGNEWLLEHFDEIMVDHLAIHVEGMENPFRQHVLPLAHRNGGVLHALLGLSACHVCTSHRKTGLDMMAMALHHRVAALNILGCMLLREQSRGLDACEEECVLAIVLLLVLHDICEDGLSSHGSHLDGVAFLCDRNAKSTDLSHPSKCSTLFFMATLAWLDMLRGFSGGEKLAYSADVRARVRDNWSFGLYMTIGYPPELFHCIGSVIDASRSQLAGQTTLGEFQVALDSAEAMLRNWDADSAVYPTNNHEWKLLANAFRHACLLRVMRWPDAFVVSCDEPRIKESVTAILDACAAMPSSSPCHKRLLFPMFIAGVDTCSPHQTHYVDMTIEQIKHATGFPHKAMTELLGKVWEERKTNSQGLVNVSWTEYTCSAHIRGAQHAYLFF